MDISTNLSSVYGLYNNVTIPSNALFIDQRQEAIAPVQIFGDNQTQTPNPQFLIYDPAFLSILGPEPSLTVLLENEQPIFHEAGVYINESLYVSSNQLDAGGAGGPMEKVIKIHQVDLRRSVNGTVESATAREVPHDSVPMANGAVNDKDGILFCAQGTKQQPGGLVKVPAGSLSSSDSQPSFQAEPVVNNYRGRPFNSPNDVVVHSDGSLWFTDPAYGFVQGFKPPPALPGQVYRFDPSTGDIRVVADGLGRPNGISFSPDQRTVYVSDSDAGIGNGTTDANRAATIYQYDLSPGDHTLSNRRVFAFADNGIPDGIKCDSQGNVYAGCGNGIHVWKSCGTLIGKILMPQADGGIANFAFGGPPPSSSTQGDERRGELFLLNENRLWYVRLGRGVKGALLG